MTSVLSSEIMQITSIKKDLGTKFDSVTKFIFNFQNLSMAHELKVRMNLELKLENIKVCLTPNRGTGEENYERFEFLGDSFLKFTCSKEQMMRNISLKEMILKKDDLISNSNLCRIAEEKGIINYYSLVSLPQKSFQPPNLFAFIKESEEKELFTEYISYFKVEKVFQTGIIDSYYHEIKNKVGDIPVSKKVYADIIEALIGMYYYEFGFKKTFTFINELKIIPKINSDLSVIEEMKKNTNLLSNNEIKEIEEKIKYSFLNKGLLEKVIIHPSYENNILGSSFFQSLEMLGDCAIDLIITIYIFNKYPSFDPAKLHCIRKGMVNNFSLSRVLNHLGLFSHVRTSFDKNHLELIKERLNCDGLKVNKMFADIFESLCGAVLVDCDFNVEKFGIFLNQLIFLMEESADFTR